jgi:hypothetical protein
MRHLLNGVILAALVVITTPGVAQAHWWHHHRMHHHYGWCCHYGWHHYGWWGYGWGPVHGPTDFMANRLNRDGLRGALQLNPQPLPP